MRYLKQPQAPAASVDTSVADTVAGILAEIERDGVAAVRRYSQRFDSWGPASFRVDPEAVKEAEAMVGDDLLDAIDAALRRVRGFARRQLECLLPLEAETEPGLVLGHRLAPVSRVGAYVPGGRHPLIASAFMTVAVAKEAGVPHVAACAPPLDEHGIHPIQLATMGRAGADAVYCVGGVQALGAMAYGVDGFEPVDMLVGPGNAFVAEAKRQLFGRVGIDLPAGPSEILILADAAADPQLIATDLIAQAEHGPTSEAVLATTAGALAHAVIAEVDHLLEETPADATARTAWANRGAVLLCDDEDELVCVADKLASEHVEIHADNAEDLFARLTNFGTACIGSASAVVYSDKAIGTNHVLPTDRAARFTGGLWVGTFLRVLTYQRVTDADAIREVGNATALISDAEGLRGHAASARVRVGGGAG